MSGRVEFNKYRKQMMKAAKDLRYGQDTVDKIGNAKNDSEITRIMTAARTKQMAEEGGNK